MDSESSTKSRIVDCFLDLLAERPYDEISIGDVSALAGVSRQTFYYHFDNLFDVCQYRIDQEREKRARRYTHEALLDNVTEDAITLYVLKRLIIPIYHSRSKDKLENSIFDNCYAMARAHFEAKSILESEYALDLPCRFMAHAYTGLTIDWIAAGMPDKLTEIKRIVKTLVNYGTLYGSAFTTRDNE